MAAHMSSRTQRRLALALVAFTCCAAHAQDASQPEVAPNLQLPDHGYFWALDIYQNAPELFPVVQPLAEMAARERARQEIKANPPRPDLPPAGDADAEANHEAAQPAEKESRKERKADEKKAAAAAAAAAAAKERAFIANAALQPPLPPDAKSVGDAGFVVLQGTHSRREFHIETPTFYLRAGTFPHPAFVLIRMQVDVKHQTRRIASPPAEALAGGNGRGFAAVQVQAMPGGKWVKLTMPTDLPYGEYCLVRILNKQQWDANVWDFGEDPGAPENGEAVTR